MDESPLVVVLHGLARTALSMRGLDADLRRRGYATWNFTWPSRRVPVAQAALAVRDGLVAAHGEAVLNRPVHAVTHSLGGIVALHLARHLAIGHLVMLAPPVRGSRVARAFADWRLFQWFYGPAGGEVAQPPDDWHPPGRIDAIGVIAGTAGLHWGNPISWATRALGVLPADLASDGTVAAAETRPDLAHHYLEVPATHTWIMDDPAVRERVAEFLASGTFAVGERAVTTGR